MVQGKWNHEGVENSVLCMLYGRYSKMLWRIVFFTRSPTHATTAVRSNIEEDFESYLALDTRSSKEQPFVPVIIFDLWTAIPPR